MFETAHTLTIQDAIRKAHTERALAARSAWQWLFHPSSSR